jgi:NAD+ kinase
VFSDKEKDRIFTTTPNRLIIVLNGNGKCCFSPEERVRVIKLLYLAYFIRLKSPKFFFLLQKKLE